MSLRAGGERERRFDVSVGQRIAAARKARGWSGVTLSRALRIDYRRLYWIESGGRCSLFLAVEIAAVLGVGLGELVRAGKQHSA